MSINEGHSMTVQQAAKVLGRSDRAVRRMIQRGSLAAQKTTADTGQLWLIPVESLARVAELTVDEVWERLEADTPLTGPGPGQETQMVCDQLSDIARRLGEIEGLLVDLRAAQRRSADLIAALSQDVTRESTKRRETTIPEAESRAKPTAPSDVADLPPSLARRPTS